MNKVEKVWQEERFPLGQQSCLVWLLNVVKGCDLKETVSHPVWDGLLTLIVCTLFKLKGADCLKI